MEFIKDLFSGKYPLINVILGGLISLLTTWLMNLWQNKRSIELQREREKTEDRRWLRDRREALYLDLTSRLEKIKIPIDEESLNIDSDSIRKNIEDIADFVENNRGRLYFYLPDETYKELLILRSELYKVCSGVNLYDSDQNHDGIANMTKCVIHAKHISSQLKQNLCDDFLVRDTIKKQAMIR